MSSNKRYTIVITEQCVETVWGGKEWEPGAGEEGEGGERQFGYSPEIRKKEVVTREIYKQDVNRLNLVEVIHAVNLIEQSN